MRLSGSFQYSIKKSVNLEASSHTQPSYKPKIVSAGRPVSCQKHPAGPLQIDSLLFWRLWRCFPSLLASSFLTACTAEIDTGSRWRLLLTHLHGNDTNPPRPRQLRMRTLMHLIRPCIDNITLREGYIIYGLCDFHCISNCLLNFNLYRFVYSVV